MTSEFSRFRPNFVSGEQDGAEGGSILTIPGNEVTFWELSRRFLEVTSFSWNFSEPKS